MDLVAYIRVSQGGEREGDSFQSPDEQRRAIESIGTNLAEAMVGLVIATPRVPSRERHQHRA